MRMPGTAKPNEGTRRVMVGGVPLGGGAPVVVQSMLNAPAGDVAANLAQIEALAAAGCEVVRMAIPHKTDLDAFEAVCAASPLPVVAVCAAVVVVAVLVFLTLKKRREQRERQEELP